MSEKTESEYVTDHFKWSEFDCSDGTQVPKKYRDNVIKLAKNLEVLREFLGGYPLTINSGYRTTSYNKKIGGASRSQHLTAKAADVVSAQHTPNKIANTIEYLIKKGRMTQGGLGRYNTFTHYDIRGIKARW